MPDRSGWDVALEIAGLVRPRTQRRVAGLSKVEMTRPFVSDVGCLPWSARVLREHARKKNLALAAAGSLREAREQLTAEARAAGDVAPELPPAGTRPSIDVAPAPADAAHRALSQWEDVDRVVDGLVLAMREARRRSRPLTQKLQRALATENPAIPHPSQVQKTADKQSTTAAALRARATKPLLSEDLQQLRA